MNLNYFKGKTILVTGATGLIGSNLVDVLMHDCNPLKVIVMGRSQIKMENTFKDYLGKENFSVLEHDVAEPFPNNLGIVDLIFHAAGPMERDIVLNKPVNVIMPNLLGSVHCLEYARKTEKEQCKKVRIVMFSSITVYNNTTQEDYRVTESMTNCADSLDSPTISYSESKRMTEVIARSYAKQYGVEAVIARFSTVYGHTRNIPDTAFYEFIRKAWAGNEITINTAGLPRRDNIYVDDAISGLLAVAAKGLPGEAYNISSNGDGDNFASVDEIAKAIAKGVALIKKDEAVNVKVGDGNALATRRPGLILNNAKLKSLGWKITTDLQDGINQTIRLMYLK